MIHRGLSGCFGKEERPRCYRTIEQRFILRRKGGRYRSIYVLHLRGFIFYIFANKKYIGYGGAREVKLLSGFN